MTHKIGDRASCSECGRILIHTSDGWKHSGINQPRHMAIPAAMPLGAVWVGDAPEDEPETIMPPLPASVADLYRIIDEQLPTAAGKTQLKAFWMQIAEDSRMLDWLEKQVYAESNNDVAVLYEAMNGKPLREAIKTRMNPERPQSPVGERE